MVSNIKKKVQSFQQWQLVVIVLLLNFLNNYIFAILAKHFSISLNKGFDDNYSFTEKIVLFIIIGPIIETLLFQYVVIEICKDQKMALKYCCLLSAFIFASLHLYNVFYFLYAFVTGLLFAYLYVAGKNEKDAILLPLVTHIIYNGIAFIGKTYFS
ncbi:CPBP family intramembrane metalloprotease [Flavobacterium sp. LC2016-23]|uniref:CPBP family intramembrane glutamic endopeptidase n=1 Tax=Flavobacterium sp. LC2016-23 TaxID=2666330 RepID=UPI0012AFC1C4|nr:CPBP family intramembrane metalloprotease [Flavobacterium sp. LC2016-23]